MREKYEYEIVKLIIIIAAMSFIDVLHILTSGFDWMCAVVVILGVSTIVACIKNRLYWRD